MMDECNILRNFRLSRRVPDIYPIIFSRHEYDYLRRVPDIYPITFSRHESEEYNSDPVLRSPIQVLTRPSELHLGDGPIPTL